jgi:hypothetical protein
MTQEEFRKQILGEFIPDSRFQELCERLQQYYTETPDELSNKEALIKWKEFREWCKIMGYTTKEINEAKYAIQYTIFGG